MIYIYIAIILSILSAFIYKTYSKKNVLCTKEKRTILIQRILDYLKKKWDDHEDNEIGVMLKKKIPDDQITNLFVQKYSHPKYVWYNDEIVQYWLADLFENKTELEKVLKNEPLVFEV